MKLKSTHRSIRTAWGKTSQADSRRMQVVPQCDTKPEAAVLQIVRSLGYRPSLNVRELPGRPDLVFVRQKKAIFVHGCFWHRHCCRRGKSMPSKNCEQWERKFANNVVRDKRTLGKLRKLGWKILIVWECQLALPKRIALLKRIQTFLSV